LLDRLLGCQPARQGQTLPDQRDGERGRRNCPHCGPRQRQDALGMQVSGEQGPQEAVDPLERDRVGWHRVALGIRIGRGGTEFRHAAQWDTIAASAPRNAPLSTLFEFGYNEVRRQVTERSKLTNPVALERILQLGTSTELARLEKNMNWLATTAAVSPFIGLLGTVVGIIDAFQVLGGTSGAASISAVGPGLSEALFTTALGLFAAIPAAIMYNYFGNAVKEMGQRMDDFTLEFLNAAENSFGER